jgi:hypothetical protein
MFQTRARVQALVAELQSADRPTGEVSPGSPEVPPVSLEVFKEKMLGAVLGDMLDVLGTEDVAQRREKLREIEARHGERSKKT